LRLFSFGGYGSALAAMALVVVGAYDSYPKNLSESKKDIGYVQSSNSKNLGESFIHCLTV